MARSVAGTAGEEVQGVVGNEVLEVAAVRLSGTFKNDEFAEDIRTAASEEVAVEFRKKVKKSSKELLIVESSSSVHEAIEEDLDESIVAKVWPVAGNDLGKEGVEERSILSGSPSGTTTTKSFLPSKVSRLKYPEFSTSSLLEMEFVKRIVGLGEAGPEVEEGKVAKGDPVAGKDILVSVKIDAEGDPVAVKKVIGEEESVGVKMDDTVHRAAFRKVKVMEKKLESAVRSSSKETISSILDRDVYLIKLVHVRDVFELAEDEINQLVIDLEGDEDEMGPVDMKRVRKLEEMRQKMYKVMKQNEEDVKAAMEDMITRHARDKVHTEVEDPAMELVRNMDESPLEAKDEVFGDVIGCDRGEDKESLKVAVQEMKLEVESKIVEVVKEVVENNSSQVVGESELKEKLIEDDILGEMKKVGEVEMKEVRAIIGDAETVEVGEDTEVNGNVEARGDAESGEAAEVAGEDIRASFDAGEAELGEDGDGPGGLINLGKKAVVSRTGKESGNVEDELGKAEFEVGDIDNLEAGKDTKAGGKVVEAADCDRAEADEVAEGRVLGLNKSVGDDTSGEVDVEVQKGSVMEDPVEKRKVKNESSQAVVISQVQEVIVAKGIVGKEAGKNESEGEVIEKKMEEMKVRKEFIGKMLGQLKGVGVELKPYQEMMQNKVDDLDREEGGGFDLDRGVKGDGEAQDGEA